MKKVLGILILLFTLSLNFSFADNSQNFLKVDKYENKVVKTTNYTFDFKTNLLRIYDKTGKKLYLAVYKGDFDYPYKFLVSDKYVYYAKNMKDNTSSLMQIELSSKKTKAVKNYTLPISLGTIKDGKLYYSIDEDLENCVYKPEFRVLNLKTLKDISIATGVCTDCVEYGKTKIIYHEFKAVQNPSPLYAIGYDYKNPIILSKYVMNYKLINGKVYYIEGKPEGIDGIIMQTLYVCNEDGSGKKALTGAINGYITDFTADEVVYMLINQQQYYKMNLKTKKIVKFKPNI